MIMMLTLLDHIRLSRLNRNLLMPMEPKRRSHKCLLAAGEVTIRFVDTRCSSSISQRNLATSSIFFQKLHHMTSSLDLIPLRNTVSTQRIKLVGLESDSCLRNVLQASNL